MNPQLQKFLPYYVPTKNQTFFSSGRSQSSLNQPASSLTQPVGKTPSVMGSTQAIQGPMPQTSLATAPARQVTQTQAQAQAQAKIQAPKTTKPTSVLSAAESEYQKKLQKELDRAYKSGLENIQFQTTELQQRQPELERQVETQFQALVPGIERQRETALAEARRQYEAGLQRGQQVFGGVAGSSAAQATQDIASQELLRQQGQVQTQTAEALNKINLEKITSLSKLRDDFRKELQTINAQKFELASQKSNAQLQALQDFATRRRQLEDYYTTRQATLEDAARAAAEKATVATPQKASYLTSLGFDDAARKQAIQSFIALGDAYLSRNNLKRAQLGGREVLQDTTTNEIFDVDTGANLTIY